MNELIQFQELGYQLGECIRKGKSTDEIFDTLFSLADKHCQSPILIMGQMACLYRDEYSYGSASDEILEEIKAGIFEYASHYYDQQQPKQAA